MKTLLLKELKSFIDKNKPLFIKDIEYLFLKEGNIKVTHLSRIPRKIAFVICFDKDNNKYVLYFNPYFSYSSDLVCFFEEKLNVRQISFELTQVEENKSIQLQLLENLSLKTVEKLIETILQEIPSVEELFDTIIKYKMKNRISDINLSKQVGIPKNCFIFSQSNIGKRLTTKHFSKVYHFLKKQNL